MHEWALAEAIVETLKAKARERDSKSFKYLKIVLGRLQQIDRDILSYALGELMAIAREEEGIEVDRIVFEYEDVVAICNRCGRRWAIDLERLREEEREFVHYVPESVHAYIRCPTCGSHDYEIESGRGLRIEVG